MSLFGSMKTSVSGMNAQANRLSTVAENIANANTTSYKKASVSFSSMVLSSTAGNYNSGGIETSVRRAVLEQGDISYTSSDTDLSISGAGFFVVQDASGVPVLTRAGDFAKDGSGNLVNSAGYTLMGYPYGSGEPAVVVNGFSGLVPINLNDSGLSVVPSTQGTFSVNLPANEQSVGSGIAGLPPSANRSESAYSKKLTMTFSDNNETSYADVYFTKIGSNQWEVTAFGRHGSSAPSGFPYDTSAPSPMASTVLTFDHSTGALVSGDPHLTVYAQDRPLEIDLSGMTQTTAPPAVVSDQKVAFNLPSDASTYNYPAEMSAVSNNPNSVYNFKQTYAGFGGTSSDIAVDVYFQKQPGAGNTWDVTFYNSADATAGGFPYSSGPLNNVVLAFDPVTGVLDPSSPATIGASLPTGDVISFDISGMTSLPSTAPAVSGTYGSHGLAFNLSPSKPTVTPQISGVTPAQNQPTSTYTEKTSLAVYNRLGNTVVLDIYYSKGADGMWEVSVFNQADASPGGFPYGAVGSPPLATTLH